MAQWARVTCSRSKFLTLKRLRDDLCKCPLWLRAIQIHDVDLLRRSLTHSLHQQAQSALLEASRRSECKWLHGHAPGQNSWKPLASPCGCAERAGIERAAMGRCAPPRSTNLAFHLNPVFKGISPANCLLAQGFFLTSWQSSCGVPRSRTVVKSGEPELRTARAERCQENGTLLGNSCVDERKEYFQMRFWSHLFYLATYVSRRKTSLH